MEREAEHLQGRIEVGTLEACRCGNGVPGGCCCPCCCLSNPGLYSFVRRLATDACPSLIGCKDDQERRH